MKQVTSDELIAASKVLELAASIRKDAWEAFSQGGNLSMEEWRDAHPVSEFVPIAFKKLEDTARQIEAIRASNH